MAVKWRDQVYNYIHIKSELYPMQKIHFIEFEWYKENILYYMYVFTFAKYSNTRLLELFSQSYYHQLLGLQLLGFWFTQLNYEIKHFAYSISLIGYYYIKALLYII